MKKYINKLELKNGIKVLKNKTALMVFVSTLSIVSLTSCGEQETNDYTSKTTEMTTEATTEITTEATTEYIEPTTEVTTEAITEITTEKVTETTTEEKSKDEIVTEFIDEQKQELQQYIDSNDVENIKEKGKYIFTTLVDFIFYDGTICGIKYDELSDGVKEQLFSDLCDIDSIVNNYVPNYKEDLADKYYKVKDFISPYYYSTTDKIKEYIGSDNMDKLEDIKENASEVGEDLWNKSKEKIKEKYENWRDE